MPMTHQSRLSPVGQMCRTVAATLIAGLWRRTTASEVEARLNRLGLREQIGLVGGVLGMMFLLSLFSAQFGLLGLLAFWLAVIVIVN